MATAVGNRPKMSHFLTSPRKFMGGWAKYQSEFFKFNLGPNLYFFLGRHCAAWSGFVSLLKIKHSSKTRMACHA